MLEANVVTHQKLSILNCYFQNSPLKDTKYKSNLSEQFTTLNPMKNLRDLFKISS